MSTTTTTPDESSPDDGTRGSQARAEAVARFAQAFLERYGSSLQRDGDEDARQLRAELTPELAAHFERESLSLVFQPGGESASADAVLVTPGSRLFGRMLGWLRERGQVCWLSLPATHPAIEVLPEVDQPDHLEGEPAVESLVGIDLELAVRVAFVAEERHEELCLVHVPQHGAATVVERSQVRALQQSGQLESASSDVPAPPPDVLEARIAVGLEAARQWAHQAGKPREERILEQLSREVQRLTHYFGDLIAEHELEDEVRESLAAELDRRVSEEVGKHRLAVELVPLACAVVARPMVSFTWTDADGDAWIYVYDRVTGEVRKPVVVRG